MPDPGGGPVWLSVALFAAAGVVILLVGTRLAGVADVLAERTGLGEALTGAVLLGASTSLSGIITSATAAAGGNPELAVSNAVGGIAAQTVFLVVADAFYRRANLEHAAASAANIMQGVLLVGLLSLTLLAFSGPDISLLAIHPATPLILAGYILGLRMIRNLQEDPMWGAKRTSETQIEGEEDSEDSHSAGLNLRGLWLRLAVYAPLIGAAGWVVGRTGSDIATQTGLSATIVGGVLTAVVTSLPELVTSVAAVRRGALKLAVGGIIGGNAFDSIFIAVSDVAYRDGSIYHAINDQQVYLISLTILMTGMLLLGLLRRERHGIANVGSEGIIIPLLYAGSFVMLALS